MRSTIRTTAILAGITLIAACGGDGGDSARSRLAARGGSGSAAEVAAPASPAESAGGVAPATVVEQSGSSAVEAQQGATAAPQGRSAPSSGRTERPGPASASGPTGPAERPAPVAAGPSAAGANPAAGSAGASQANTSAGPVPAPGTPGVLDPGSRTGVTDREVVFGMHLPQSGPVGFLVGKAWHGAEAFFRSVNDAGGVHGRKIRMVVADDGYSAQKAAGAIRDLVDDKKVFAASCLAGLDQCVVGMEYANAKGVPYLHGGMSEAAVEGKAWSFPVTSSYPYGAGRLADYMFTKRGYTPARKIGALHVNSPYYAEMAAQMETQLKTYGSKFVEKQVAEKDQSDFSAAIIKMQNAGVDTLWFFVDPTLIAKFAAQAKALRFQPQYVFSPPAGGDLFATAGGGNLDGAFGLATVADPAWPGAAGFRKIFNAYYPDDEATEFDVLAYAVAHVFVEGLRRAGPDLGRDAFARALATVDSLDTGVSSPLSYTRRHRLSAANSTLAVWEIRGTKTEQLTGFDF